jgi:hypothetical protein
MTQGMHSLSVDSVPSLSHARKMFVFTEGDAPMHNNNRHELAFSHSQTHQNLGS